MSNSSTPSVFWERLNAGDNSAVGEVYAQYIKRLCQAATGLIGARLKGQYSAEDAAHSALASFIRGIDERRYQVDASRKLWALLMTIMVHKIQKRGGEAQEYPLTADVVDGDLSHEKAVELADAVETSMAGLKVGHAEICGLFYFKDFSVPEISLLVGCSRWTVRRVLNAFGYRLRKHLEDKPEN